MAKEIIAVDIDDVLAACAEAFVAFSNERWGTHLTPDQYLENWSEMWQIDHDETEERATEYHASGDHFTYEHNPDAIEVLRELQQNYRLVIVTSRRRVVDKQTHAWLDKYFAGIFDSVHFAGIYDEGVSDVIYAKSKGDVFKSLGVQYVIDDQPKHCKTAAELGVEAILFSDYPWNRDEKPREHITRCHDWQAVKEYFDGRR